MPQPASGQVEAPLPIDEVVRRFGVKASALRYYEDIGLLQPGFRRSGRRYYGLDDLRRLALIQLLQSSANMSLKEIADIVACSLGERDARAIIQERIDVLQQQIQSAQSASRYLTHRLNCPRENPFDQCVVLGAQLAERLQAVGVSALAHGEIAPQVETKCHDGSDEGEASRI